MHGLLTSDPALAREAPGDVTHFLADRVDGTRDEPVPGTVTAIACWGDSRTVAASPERAAVSGDGIRATPAAEGHHWGTVCPTDDAYRSALLERIERAGRTGPVRLTTVGLPGPGFCRCDRCLERTRASRHDTWAAWRADPITDLVAAADRLTEELIVTLHPDPHPESLLERSGIDLGRLVDHVDGILVPLCGDYTTPYWVETLARAVGHTLGDLPLEVTIQLSLAGEPVERVLDVTRMVEPHCDVVCFGAVPSAVDTARAVLEHRTAARAGC